MPESWLGDVGIRVKDLRELLRFYSKVLGLVERRSAIRSLDLDERISDGTSSAMRRSGAKRFIKGLTGGN